MSPRRSVLASVGVAIGAVLGIGLIFGPEGAPSLSPLRVAALAAVAEVVPAIYGSEDFARLAPGFSPEILKKYPGYSTCGYLPSWVARRLGARGRILQAGTNLVRDEAQKRGAWVEWKPGRLPKPGDFYALVNAAGGVVHVGVVISATDAEWETADAGQGTPQVQQSAKVRRAFNALTGQLASGTGTKLIGGWLDIEAFPFGEDK